MVDTGIFCTTAEVQYRAGDGVSTTANVETYINSFVAQAESYINVACKYNFSDTYSTLNADVKGILKKAASCIAAIDVINFDMSGIRSRVEAQVRCNILKQLADDCIAQLQSKDKQYFVNGA
jgi:hypothetical protein